MLSAPNEYCTTGGAGTIGKLFHLLGSKVLHEKSYEFNGIRGTSRRSSWLVHFGMGRKTRRSNGSKERADLLRALAERNRFQSISLGILT